jgi:hypothetical protein
MLSYELIFSRVRSKIDDPKELSLDENYLTEIYIERLHSSIGIPRVRRLFSSITFDDEIQQIDYTLINSVDEFSDDEFIIEVLSLGMVIEWLRQKVDSVLYVIPMIGGKEEKKILDGHKDMIERLATLKKEQYKLIRDYGYIYNSYVNGD